jgi:F-type H+-transporting ATPase subunit a
VEDPIHQFQIERLFSLGTVGGHEIAFTNSALFMLIAVVGVTALLVSATSRPALVPGRLQAVAEMSYEFVASTIRNTAGTEGMKFVPLVFSLFMFIRFMNLIGLLPYAFAVTSHIIITSALAGLVFLIVVVYGFHRNGLQCFKLFVPKGVPAYILPLIVFIEVLSFLSRPLSRAS